MKISELFEQQKGTYAGIHFSDKTKNALSQYIDQHKIPGGITTDMFHSTLLYNRTPLPEYKPLGKIDPPLIGTPVELKIWDFKNGGGGKNGKGLVLTYKCPKLNERHSALVKDLNASWDYPNYIPHITLSNDIGEYDINQLPKFTHPIEIVEEYYEPLDTKWSGK